MSKTGIFALFVLSQFGCTVARPYTPTGPVTIGVRCPNGGCAQPIAAANQYLARYQMRMVESPAGSLTLIMAGNIDGPCRAEHPGIAGCATPGEPVVYMNYDHPEQFGTTLLHEAGHTLGYSHQPAGLMHPHQANPTQIPVGYLARLRDQYGAAGGVEASGFQEQEIYSGPPPRSTRQSQREITYGNQLPRGVTRESIERDRRDPRTDCPECMGSQWTLHGDWRKSPMFQRGGLYEVQERPDGSVRHVGRGWQPFSKFPPTGGGQ